MRVFLTMGLLSALACGQDRAPPLTDTPAVDSQSVVPSSPVVADTISGFDITGDWRLTPARVGPVVIGTSLAEALPLLEAGIDTAAIADGCDYIRAIGAPAGLMFMVENRQLVRADVRDGATSTPEGARLGDEEGRILELYPSARRMPHRYIDGSYLVVMPFAPSDTLRRYVFETDGQRVITFRAGLYPPVEYVEGCS